MPDPTPSWTESSPAAWARAHCCSFDPHRSECFPTRRECDLCKPALSRLKWRSPLSAAPGQPQPTEVSGRGRCTWFESMLPCMPPDSTIPLAYVRSLLSKSNGNAWNPHAVAALKQAAQEAWECLCACGRHIPIGHRVCEKCQKHGRQHADAPVNIDGNAPTLLSAASETPESALSDAR